MGIILLQYRYHYFLCLHIRKRRHFFFESDHEEGPAAGLKEQAVARLGKHNYLGFYHALKEFREMNTPDSVIFTNLQALYGPAAIDCFHLVDQIIYYEMH